MAAFSDLYADVVSWIVEQHPDLAGARIRSFSWGYNLSSETAEMLSHTINGIVRDGAYLRVVSPNDLEDLVERVLPPSGYAYVTVMKGRKRYGVNVPKLVFQQESKE